MNIFIFQCKTPYYYPDPGYEYPPEPEICYRNYKRYDNDDNGDEDDDDDFDEDEIKRDSNNSSNSHKIINSSNIGENNAKNGKQ